MHLSSMHFSVALLYLGFCNKCENSEACFLNERLNPLSNLSKVFSICVEPEKLH